MKLGELCKLIYSLIHRCNTYLLLDIIEGGTTHVATVTAFTDIITKCSYQKEY